MTARYGHTYDIRMSLPSRTPSKPHPEKRVLPHLD